MTQMFSSQTFASAGKPAPLLSLRGVTKSYHRRLVVRIDEFDANIGDSIIVFGNNGSGKSTFLRLLTGITNKSSGELHRSALLRSYRTVFVPQVRGLSPDLTVAQNIRDWLRLYDLDAQDDISRMPYVSILGLKPFLDHRVRDLSGGFQKLATLAAALVVNPQAIFLDEPLIGLDESSVRVVGDVIDTLATTVPLLVVTGHSRAFFTRFTRPVRIVDGHLEGTQSD